MISSSTSFSELSGKDAKESSLKDLIVLILSNQWPITARKLYFILREKKNISYQAVHKSLNYLTKNKVVEKHDMEYMLNIEWIGMMRHFIDKIESTYQGSSQLHKDTIQKDISEEEVMQMSFKKKIDLGKFIIERFLSLPNEKKKFSVCRWHHMYNMITLPQNYIEMLKKAAADSQFYILCYHQTPFDVFLAKMYEQMNGKVRLGVECAISRDSFVWGDYVAQVFWSNDARMKIDKEYNEIKDIQKINLSQLAKSIYNEEYACKVILVKNPRLAEQLRKETLLDYSRRKYASIIGLVSLKIEDKKKTYEFQNFDDAERFRKELQRKYLLKPRKYGYFAKTIHFRSPIIYSERSLHRIESINKNKIPVNIVVKGNTPTDKWIADIYRSTIKDFANIKTGVSYLEKYDLMVCGNEVIKIIMPQDIIEIMDKLYLKAKTKGDINIIDLFENVYRKKAKVLVTIENNPKEAKRLRDDIINELR